MDFRAGIDVQCLAVPCLHASDELISRGHGTGHGSDTADLAYRDQLTQLIQLTTALQHRDLEARGDRVWYLPEKMGTQIGYPGFWVISPEIPQHSRRSSVYTI